jgi:hypothetical protein
LSYPGAGWKSLDLIDVGDMFHARVVLRSGAVPVRYSFTVLIVSGIRLSFIVRQLETNLERVRLLESVSG